MAIPEKFAPIPQEELIKVIEHGKKEKWSCLPGSGWISAKLITWFSKDDKEVATKIFAKLQNNQMDSSTLRCFSNNQLAELKIKLVSQPIAAEHNRDNSLA